MDASALRNFRDFLQLYNKMTEICFSRCIDNINSRNLDQNEVDCVDDCSSKFIKFNNKLMQNFVKAQTDIVNKRVEEAEKQQRLEAPEEKLQENKSPITEQTVLENYIRQGEEQVHTDLVISK